MPSVTPPMPPMPVSKALESLFLARCPRCRAGALLLALFLWTLQERGFSTSATHMTADHAGRSALTTVLPDDAEVASECP
jgi:hypothetical protein